MNNETDRQTETKPTQHKHEQKKDRATKANGGNWRQRIGRRAECSRMQQSVRVQTGSGKGSAGLLHLLCLRFGLTTARPHGPWWCRKLGIASEDRQGKAAGTCCRRGTRYRAADPWWHWYGCGGSTTPQPGVPGSQPGWDETKAAVAGCKRSNRSRRTTGLFPNHC